MIYPEFIKEGSTIGICAPSAGVGKKLESFDISLNTLHENGWKTKETENVRIFNERGGTPEERAAELKSLFEDDEVDMIMAAAGGDFLFEMLEHTDFEVMKNHPKWMMGASDPTGLLFPYTLLCDVATLYGMNAGSYDIFPFPQYVEENLELLKGNIPTYHSSKMHMSKPKFMVDEITYDAETVYGSNVQELHVSGRCIGGCIDCMKDLIGTPLVPMKEFTEKYKEDGQIFYFDNFAMSAENFYRTLLQMKLAGWFTYAKAVILGRVLLPSSETGMSYHDAMEKALGDIPWIDEADIGHTLPSMTMINGAVLHLDYKDGEADFSFTLE